MTVVGGGGAVAEGGARRFARAFARIAAKLLARSLGTTLVAGLASFVLASPAQAADEDFSFAVASYNVWNLPVITPHRAARIDEIARRLGELDADVVALQELWVADDAARIADVLGAAGLIHAHYFGPDEGRGSGLFIASRHRIADVRFDAFRVGTTPFIPWHLDWLSRKGVGIVRIETPAGPVDVANTHLHASYRIGDYGFVQLSQALQIHDFIGALAPSSELPPLLLVGDLNVVPSSLPHQALVSLGGLEPARPDFVLDHVLARSGSDRRLRVEQVDLLFEDEVQLAGGGAAKLSDHPCVLARYTLSECDDCAAVSATAPATWTDLSGTLASHLRDELSRTARFMRVYQIAGVGCVVLGLWHLRRLRNVPRRRAAMLSRLGAALGLVAAGGWFVYLGWLFAPQRLDEIAALEATLTTRAPIARR